MLTSLLLEMGAETAQPIVPFVATTAIPQPGDQTPRFCGPGRQFPHTIGGLVNHQTGTMRMGSREDESVVDPFGRFWGIPNLVVADASLFPTSGGYNPTLTVQALAWRVAEEVSRNLRGRSPPARAS